MSKQLWPGLFLTMRRFLYGEANPPKAKRYGETTTPTTSNYYEGMHRYYRWFRQDSYTRKCILTNAYFATMTAGFETTLEPTGRYIDVEDYAYVKEKIDEYNKDVNMDLALFVAQIKRSIYGKSGFEIVLDEEEAPAWLLSLQSTKLKPNVNENWELTGFRYEGRENFYEPDEVLYFVNLPLEADYEGLSDVEAVVDAALEARAKAGLVVDRRAEAERLKELDDQTLDLLREDAEKVAEKMAKAPPTGPKAKYTADDKSAFEGAVEDARERLFGRLWSCRV